MAHVNNYSEAPKLVPSRYYAHLLNKFETQVAQKPNGTGTATRSEAAVQAICAQVQPRKFKNPLLAPYLGAGATEEQLSYLLFESKWYLKLIAPHMRTPLPARDAERLCIWISNVSQRGLVTPEAIRLCAIHRPVELPLTSKAERGKWMLVVRQSMGLPEYTFLDKVLNRIQRMFFDWSTLLIPLEEGEALLVWLLAILGLAAYIVVTGTLLLTGMFLAAVLGTAVIAGVIAFVGGLFSKKNLCQGSGLAWFGTGAARRGLTRRGMAG